MRSDDTSRRPKVNARRAPAVGLSEEKRLTYRLLLRTTLAISSVVLIILFVSEWVDDNQRLRNTLTNMNEQVDNIRDALEATMLDSSSLKRERAQGYFSGMGKNPDFKYLQVLSIDTTVVFSSRQEEIGNKPKLLEAAACRGCHGSPELMRANQRIYIGKDGERNYHFVLPIENKPACRKCHEGDNSRRATLVVDYSLARVDRETRQFRVQHLVMLVVLIVVFIATLYYLLNYVVYQPIELIAERLARVARGDFSTASTSPRTDLVGFINRQIDITASQLKGVYDKLELKVLERTHSLQLSQQALLDEKDKLRFMLDNSPQGFLGLSEDATILFANHQACEILAAEPDEIVGRPASDYSLIKTILDSDLISEEIGSNTKSRPERVFTHEGKHFAVEATVSTTAKNERLHLLMLIDVTEKRKIQQTHERQERLASVGQLAAGVAHEVGNPLSAISSLVQISQKAPEPEALRHNLDLITYHIDRITRIVRNLSDFARLPDEQRVAADLFEIVRSAADIAGFDNRAKHVTFDIVPPDQVCRADVARDQLLQAFLNIMLNALDALEKTDDAVLTIRAYQADGQCHIVIGDNGTGISEEQLKRIFEPFYTTKPVGKGTGLGLSVTYRIVNDLGGSIDVASVVGRGSTFTIIIPECEK